MGRTSSYWQTVIDPPDSVSASSSRPRPIEKPYSRACPLCARVFASPRAYDEHKFTCRSRPAPRHPPRLPHPYPGHHHHALPAHPAPPAAPAHASASTAPPAPDKPYECHECGTAFKKNSNLVKHMKLVHRGERNFECTEPGCGRMFGQKSNLNSHVKAVHLGEKPFVCTEPACNRRFSQKSGLKAHVKTVHNGERPYVCHCGSSFGHRGDLNRHIRVLHEKQRPFECPLCPEPKRFGRKSVLMRHMLTHPDAPPSALAAIRPTMSDGSSSTR